MTKQRQQESKPYQFKFLNLPDKEFLLPWGICIPDGCSADDAKFITIFIFKYSENLCQTSESQVSRLDTEDYVAISVLSVIGCVVVVSTILDIVTRHKKRTFIVNICISFSLPLNYNRITSKDIDEDEITCLNGMRIITMFFVMGGLRFLMYPLSVVDNWIDLLTFITDRYNIIILEALVSIDTFFVISGVLISYNFLIRRAHGAKFNIFFFILNRLIRFTPALVIVVLLQSTLLRHYGSGPLWPTLKGLYIVDSCRQYWWTTLLYIQNYYNPGLTSICVMPSWYLAVNMQLFILSSFLLWPLAKAPKYTIAFVCFLLTCAIASAFLVSWVYDLNSIFAFNITPAALEKFLQHFYFPLHTRASSWIVGFIFGYILFETKKPALQEKIKKVFKIWVVLLLWVLTMGALVFCLLINQTFIKLEYNWVYHSLHNAFVRPIWAVAMGWIIFACTHGYGGPINLILSLPGYRSLSKIAYCTFLVNFSMTLLLTGQTRQGLHFSVSDGFSRFWGDLVWSLGFGLLFSLTIESPFIFLINTISEKYANKDEKVTSNIENGMSKELKLS